MGKNKKRNNQSINQDEIARKNGSSSDSITLITPPLPSLLSTHIASAEQDNTTEQNQVENDVQISSTCTVRIPVYSCSNVIKNTNEMLEIHSEPEQQTITNVKETSANAVVQEEVQNVSEIPLHSIHSINVNAVDKKEIQSTPPPLPTQSRNWWQRLVDKFLLGKK
jgi:hypothetical protein